MNIRHLPLALLCAGSPLLGQNNTFVVPSKVNTYRPGSVWYDDAPQQFALWGSTSSSVYSRSLFLYDAADIPVPAAVLQALSFRAPYNYNLPAATYQTTIVVSASNTPVTGILPAFASNHGPNPTTVFTGSLNVGPSPNGAWPAAWQTPIPFASPVVWTNASPSLAVEFQTTGSSAGQTWTLEGIRAEWGFNTNEHYQPNCLNTAGNSSGSWGWSPGGLVPGGTFSLSMFGYPQNQSLSANALFFGLSGQGSSFGGLVTPFPLAAVGLPASPNCNWSIGILGSAGYTMSYQTSGTTAYLSIQNLQLPNTPAFAGAQFYTQDIALDLDVNTGIPLLFPSVALRWTIGTGITVPCSTVYNLSSSGIPVSGGTRPSEAAVFQLTY